MQEADQVEARLGGSFVVDPADSLAGAAVVLHDQFERYADGRLEVTVQGFGPLRMDGTDDE